MSIVDFYKNNNVLLNKNEIKLIVNNKHILTKYNEISNRIYEYTYYKSPHVSHLIGLLFCISKKYNIKRSRRNEKIF